MNKNCRLPSFRSFFIFSFLSFFEGSPSSGFFFRAGKPESGFGVVGLKAKPTGPLFIFTIFPRSLR